VVTLTWEMTGATIASSPLTGINVLTVYTFNVGVTTITYTVTDSSGNVTTCSFDITITSKPEIECPGDITTNTDADVCTASLDPGYPTLLSGVEPIDWTWEMTGATTGSGTGIPITPNPYEFNVGTTTITWIATNISGADTCVQVITVIDDQPPTFTPPAPFSLCVNNIIEATYYDPTMDITPDRPEYYIFEAGSEVFDLNTSSFLDNCGLSCSVAIRWRIDFADGSTIPPLPDLYVTGQPSDYGTEIHLPGDGITFLDVEHFITYWIEDCHGNVSDPQQVSIIIKPRPNVIKQ
jgi:hypothetical protein